MSTNLKISLSILFVAIVAFAGIYAKFNIFNDNNKNDIVIGEIVTNMNNESDWDLFNTNKLDLLIERSKNRLEKNSKDLDILTKLANAYLQKGSLEFKEKEYGKKGLEIAERILVINPNSVIGLNLEGYANEIMEKYPEALKAYKKSLEIEKTVNTLNQIGHVYDLMGDDKKSREYYSLAAKMNPNDTSVKMNLARVNYDDKKYTEALEGFKYVYNNDKNIRRKAEASYMISQIYLSNELYDVKEAVKYAELSKDIDPKFPTAWVGVATTAVVYGLNDKTSDFDVQIKKALESFDKAIEIYPNHTDAHLQKAKLLLMLGDRDGSIKEYKLALSSVKKDILLMNDSKKELEKFIKEDMEFNNIKIASIFEDILLAVTFPSKVSAWCRITGQGHEYCTSREDAIAYITAQNNKINNDKNNPHYWSMKTSYSACNNGAILTWPPVCGNGGKIEKGEQCDDGNKYDGDGCSSTCKIEDAKCGNSNLECLRGTPVKGKNTKTKYIWSCRPIIKGGSIDNCEAIRPYCGDNKVSSGEECDNGILNGVLGGKCTETCKIVPIVNYCFCENDDTKEYNCSLTNSQISKICKTKCTHNCGGGTDDDLSDPTDDDLSDPTDDDLTNVSEDRLCKLHPAMCVNTPQGDIDVDVYWSVDKIHWDDDFTKLIQLKHKSQKVYIKNTPKGKCNSNRGPIGLFNFGFSATEGHNKNFMKKEKAEEFQDSVMFTTGATKEAPVGEAFKQKLDVNYCTSDAAKTKELNIKIVDIRQTEI